MRFSCFRYVIFVLFSSLTISCDNEESNNTDISFVKFFGEGSGDNGADMCLLGETIVILSDITDSADKVSPCLYYFNMQGKMVEDPRIFDDRSNNEYSQKLLIDEDKDLYIVSNEKNVQDSVKILIRKIRNNEVVWDKYFGSNLNLESSDALISGTEIAVIGNIRKSEDYIDAFFIKLSIEGDIIKQRRFGGSSNDMASKIIKIGNEYIFVGYTESWSQSLTSGGEKDRCVWLVKIDNYDHISLGSENINEGLDVKQNGTSILIASNERRTENGANALKIYSIEYKDLKPEWETEFADNNNIVPADIQINSNRLMVPSNKFDRGKTSSNICVFYFGIDGSYISKKELGASETLLQVNKSIFLDDGNLLLLGKNEFKGNSDIAFIKLNTSNVLYK